MKKVLFTATVDSHILHFHIPYLKLFKDKGYEVHVATNGDEEIPYCDVKHKISFERSPIKINNLKAIKDLKKIIQKEEYEIIHCHTPMGSVVTRLAAKKARKKGTRVIYTAHGFHFYSGAPKKFWIVFYPIEKFLSRYTDTLITINKEDYDLAKAKFHCDVEYVPGVGINKEKFDIEMTETEKDNLRNEIGITKEDFVMIYPAEISDRKNQKWLIKSLESLIKKYSNIHLLLPGSDSLNGEINRLIEESDLRNNVHLLGYRKDIPNLLKISNLAISSSRQEGLPVNIMESMYVGLPIIATDCRGNRDLITNGDNGYIVAQGDSDNLNKIVEELYKNKNDVEEMRARTKVVAEQYLIENIIGEYENIYNI